MLPQDTLAIEKEKITVTGETSVGNFSCTYERKETSTTIVLNREITEQPSLELSIPVKDFACGNFLLNRDFRKTLNAKQYPMIYIAVMSLEKLPEGVLAQNTSDPDTVVTDSSVRVPSEGDYSGNIQLEIAGKQVNLNCNSQDFL